MSLTDACTYTVHVFRRDGFWILDVPELRAVGQARTLATAGHTARELVALWLDIPTDQVHVVLNYDRIDPEAIELATGARTDQARAEELSRGAASRLREAARRLVHTDGLSLRDAATVLGVTFGRVNQLLKD
jgi:DNA-directed RNA polymerase specialized sigma24 family protein